MLQQWFKPIVIALTAESITIRSGLKKIDIISLPVATEKSSWNSVLTALDAIGSNIKGRSVSFILSNHYVRYAILPWRDGVFSQQDWQSLAEHHLQAVHGNVVDNWKIKVAMQGYGQPLIVSAIDQYLLLQLEALAQQFGWIIETIEPALMTAVNLYSKKIKKNDWLMMIDHHRIVVVEMVKGCVTCFSLVTPPDGQEPEESIKLLRRTLQLQNIIYPETIHIFGEQQLQPNAILDGINLVSLTEEQDNTEMSTMLVAQ